MNGITLNQKVFIDPNMANGFQDIEGIKLLGHELVHTLQFRALGPLFLQGYLQNYSFNRIEGNGVAGMTHRDAYRNIQAEDLAFAVGNVISDFLTNNLARYI